jgi:hypothetical protein
LIYTGYYLAGALYLLGAAMYLVVLEATDEENAPNAALIAALVWPYIALRVIIERIIYGDEER